MNQLQYNFNSKLSKDTSNSEIQTLTKTLVQFIQTVLHFTSQSLTQEYIIGYILKDILITVTK